LKAQKYYDSKFQKLTRRQMSRRYQSSVYREIAGLVSGLVHVSLSGLFWLAVLVLIVLG
jgi:hypothetical protein